MHIFPLTWQSIWPKRWALYRCVHLRNRCLPSTTGFQKSAITDQKKTETNRDFTSTYLETCRLTYPSSRGPIIHSTAAFLPLLLRNFVRAPLFHVLSFALLSYTVEHQSKTKPLVAWAAGILLP
jgi:hypothetical protein